MTSTAALPFGMDGGIVLGRLTSDQWEALCDGCARCCLHKLQDEESGRLVTTMVACRLLDRRRCRCRQYAGRFQQVPECVPLTVDNVYDLKWLPPSCAYRRLAEGRPLARWHPLISGDPASIHAAGISVRDFAMRAEDVHPDEWHALAIDWSDDETEEKNG